MSTCKCWLRERGRGRERVEKRLERDAAEKAAQRSQQRGATAAKGEALVAQWRACGRMQELERQRGDREGERDRENGDRRKEKKGGVLLDTHTHTHISHTHTFNLTLSAKRRAAIGIIHEGHAVCAWLMQLRIEMAEEGEAAAAGKMSQSFSARPLRSQCASFALINLRQ